MVKLEEVEDDHFAQEQPGPKLAAGDDDDFYTDTGTSPSLILSPLRPFPFSPLLPTNPPATDSSISSDDENSPSPALDETLADRLLALRDMVPPAQRRYLSATVATATAWARRGLLLGGKTLWVVSTSALLVGVPWALAWSEEQQMMEMEREMRMQQSASEVSSYFILFWFCWVFRDGRGCLWG